MTFTETAVPGAFVIEPELVEDERGFFARFYDEAAFAERGLATHVAHLSVSFNRLRGTLRGMHYQTAPFEECKLVRCTRGAVYDVLIDLRRESPKYCGWVSVKLSAENRIAVYIPKGVAHGFQTLGDGTELLYQISAPYSREHARGVRWDDPAFGIEWPEAPRVVSERDRSYPYFDV